ncbi:hypothetical protein PHLGIDRAFT_128011 [Phlebiopsis gigantea 11061_1 CR5-6]|uniref:Uncharacterized protein n=1 Tax=Phlebiopsis gigantea (strain 11061_1 CR5-6) TaxID=745531 RepID=A0A0C3S7Q1_PHLG1|nr:hypothetical protein PHLGIDRAFT_128011 [Phlebiopsis gigantea 11061_1 CR5-6]
MSVLPPLSAEPGTPAHEWAAKTTIALEPDRSTPIIHSMNPTTHQLFEEKNMRPGTTADAFGNAPVVPHDDRTPSQDIPGAFPNQEELQARGQEVMQTASEAASKFAQSVQNTAATYIPIAAETVGAYLPKSVVDRVSGYIPGMTNPQGDVLASEHDHLHTKSMPSTELTGYGTGEHVGGAGALPGPITESGVTRLPDERDGSWQVPTAAGAAATATAAAAGAAGAVKETAQDTTDHVTGRSTAVAPGPISGPATLKYSMPSEEESGAQPGEHVGGVGALPGRRTELGVAALPDENTRSATNVTSSSVSPHSRMYESVTHPSRDGAARTSDGVGSLPGEDGEEGVAVLPDERVRNAAGTGVGAAAVGAGVASLPMPTREVSGAQPSERSGGAGYDPGNSTESAVAAPAVKKVDAANGLDKRVAEDTAMADAAKKAAAAGSQPPASTPASHEKPKETHSHKDQPTKKPHLESSEEGKYARGQEPELRANPLQINLTPRMHALGRNGATWQGVDVGTDGYHRGEDGAIGNGDGYDTDYHPSQMHPLEGNYSKEHAEQEKEKEPVAEKDGEKPSSGSDSATNQDEDHKAKKAGFMAKMKGEAKILLGKMEGKKGHEKVEEGQRIKAGETVQ